MRDALHTQMLNRIQILERQVTAMSTRIAVLDQRGERKMRTIEPPRRNQQ
ncbi:hypothetical protein [Bradyrhizobium lablabi]|nr:hypothetical protein [Bradyrhizobium lablabi]MBR0693264.1 hypothetical protein [Bradyrhizobium lablabi]